MARKYKLLPISPVAERTSIYPHPSERISADYQSVCPSVRTTHRPTDLLLLLGFHSIYLLILREEYQQEIEYFFFAQILRMITEAEKNKIKLGNCLFSPPQQLMLLLVLLLI